MDYATLGYDSAGFIVHVTRGEKRLCQNTAKQIRSHYKSVKVVDDDVADKLLELDMIKWIRENKRMNETMANA